ncbi:GH36 C-terminal domain-containing protein, partial [Alkalibacterium iburiense]
ASSGNLGYELDVTKLSVQDKETIKEQVEFYKRNKEIIQYGNFYRIKSPFDNFYETSWIFVDDEKNNALFYYFQILDKPNGSLNKLKMTGLDPNKNYKFDNGKVYGGDELMYRGVILDPSLSGDFQGRRIILNALE